MHSLLTLLLLGAPSVDADKPRFDVEADVTAADGTVFAKLTTSAIEGLESKATDEHEGRSFALFVTIRPARGEDQCQVVRFALEQTRKADTGHVFKHRMSGAGKTCRGEPASLGSGLDRMALVVKVLAASPNP